MGFESFLNDFKRFFYKAIKGFWKGMKMVFKRCFKGFKLAVMDPNAIWSFIMKLTLKWGTLHVCRSINSRNIVQNVFSIKMQFSWFCKKNTGQMITIISLHGIIEENAIFYSKFLVKYLLENCHLEPKLLI